MKTPTFEVCGLNPLVNDHSINLKYEEILALSNSEFLAWVGRMRTEVLRIWDEDGIAPGVGWTVDAVSADFAKMSGYPVDEFWRTCELTGRRVIHNTQTIGNSVNAWNMSRMLKVRINYKEDDSGRSIYDYFAKDELFSKYLPYARRHFLRDSFYFFAQTVKLGDALPHRPELFVKDAVQYCTEFAKQVRPYDTHELLIEAKPLGKAYSGYAEHLRDAAFLVLSYDELLGLIKKKVLLPINVRIIRGKEANPEHEFHVRLYEKGKRVFPACWKSFRISMCQYAVNFPPLTAKLLYQTFLKNLPGNEVVVWDPSSGWAGRILGAMSSDLRTPDNELQHLHYLGTDPNPDFYDDAGGSQTSVYGHIADFYNTVRNNGSLFGEYHSYTVFRSGSECISQNAEFAGRKGTLDLVFTSPPYFNREAYSEDVNQSYKKFSTYESWREGFLRPTLTTAYEWLKKDRHLLWNIADLKVGKKYLPLQQDSIAICKELGFTFVEEICMTLRGMPGANRVDENGNLTAKNMVKVDGKLYKYEPVLVFRK